MLKTIQIVPSMAVESSGPQYYMVKMVASLESLGVSVDLFTLERFGRAWTPIRNLGRSPAMYRALRENVANVDVFHNNSLWMMPNIYPYWVAAGHSVKVVTSPHGTLSTWALRHGRLKKMFFGALLQYPALRRTDMFHATSEKEYEEIRALGYRQPVAIVPVGMDIPEVDVFNAEAQRSREAEVKRKRIVFFGRLHKVKGVDRLVRAWEQVMRDGWELVIAGPDCGMLEELKGIVAERRLPRVSFVGEINGHAKYEFLANADIYVLPSDTENFGVTVAEALASGTPVIASQGTPWQGLEREKCGRWVPIGVEPLAMALKELMAMSDEERAVMGNRGREWMRRDFSWRGIGLKMKTAYEWLLGNGDKPEWVRLD